MMQGYDKPIYTNVMMPIFTEPPTVPKDDKLAKKKALVLAFASGLITVVLVFVWVLLVLAFPV